MNLLPADLASCAIYQTRGVQGWWIFHDGTSWWKVPYQPNGWRARSPYTGNRTGLRRCPPVLSSRIRQYVKPVSTARLPDADN